RDGQPVLAALAHVERRGRDEPEAVVPDLPADLVAAAPGVAPELHRRALDRLRREREPGLQVLARVGPVLPREPGRLPLRAREQATRHARLGLRLAAPEVPRAPLARHDRVEARLFRSFRGSLLPGLDGRVRDELPRDLRALPLARLLE